MKTVRSNAELIGRYEWGWSTLGDRGRLPEDLNDKCRVSRHFGIRDVGLPDKCVSGQ